MNNDYIAYPKRRTKRIGFKNFLGGTDLSLDQSVLSPTVAAEIYNFDFSSGCLSDGYGIEWGPLSIYNLKSLWSYNFIKDGIKEEIIMFHGVDDNIYYIKNGVISMIEGLTIRGNIRGINYRLYEEDVILICSDCQSMVVWNGVDSPYSVESSPFLTSMTLHYERLFATDTDGETLRFSTDLDPTNWNSSLTEGGYIKLVDDKGRIGKVISFLNYVYIFREYGINRLCAYADQTEFSLSSLFTSSGKIYPNTVALCGDRVMFLASDGLYSFDGLSTHKVLDNLSGLIQYGDDACGQYFDGRYYLACRLAQNKGVGCEEKSFVNNGLIVYSISDKKYCITRGVDITKLVSAGDEILGISGNKAGAIKKTATNFFQVLKKRWASPYTDFGSDREKVFKEICIETATDISLKVIADDIEKEFFIRGSTKPQKRRINMRGKKIGFVIETNKSKTKITRPSLVVCEI